MEIRAFIKYYWGLFRFATKGAWGFSQLISGILTFIGGCVGKKHPEWGATMTNFLWEIPLAIFIILFVIRLVLAPFEEYKRLKNELEQTKKFPLEIIFDSKNPSQRFWHLAQRSPFDKNDLRPCWIYMIEIKNNYFLTLKNVSVTAEYIMEGIPAKSKDLRFDKTGTTRWDINPECSELAALFSWPKANSSTPNCGQIKVTAGADDTKSARRTFNFDSQKVPMIFD
jgi:hypothetical protein